VGTQPELYCTIHGNAGSIEMNLERLRVDTVTIDDDDILKSLTMPTLPPEFMRELNSSSSNSNTSSNRSTPSSSVNSRTPTPSSGSRNTSTPSSSSSQPATGNPFLDRPAAGAQNEEGATYIPSGSGNSPPSQGGLELPAYNPLLD
jgi:hypothetical protein